MNSDYYRRQIDGHQKKIADLQKKKADELKRASDYRGRISQAMASASRASSASTSQSYLRQAQGHEKNAMTAEKKAADMDGKIAKEYQDLARAQEGLGRAERDEAQKHRREAEKQQRESQRRAREDERRMRGFSEKLSTHDAMLERLQSLPESITVLFMASNPLDQSQLRLDEEVRAIHHKITLSKHRDAVRLESQWAVRSGDILQAMNQFKPTIVHFSGHGSDQDELVLQNDQGGTRLITLEAIVQAMAVGSDSLQLVFFNTCYSRNQAEAVVEHVPAAIGMSTSIGDEAARVFAAQFYSSIGFGLSVQTAFDQAKAALMLESIPEEDTPELFVQSGVDASDLVIVKPQTQGDR